MLPAPRTKNRDGVGDDAGDYLQVPGHGGQLHEKGHPERAFAQLVFKQKAEWIKSDDAGLRVSAGKNPAAYQQRDVEIRDPRELKKTAGFLGAERRNDVLTGS